MCPAAIRCVWHSISFFYSTLKTIFHMTIPSYDVTNATHMAALENINLALKEFQGKCVLHFINIPGTKNELKLHCKGTQPNELLKMFWQLDGKVAKFGLPADHVLHKPFDIIMANLCKSYPDMNLHKKPIVAEHREGGGDKSVQLKLEWTKRAAFRTRFLDADGQRMDVKNVELQTKFTNYIITVKKISDTTVHGLTFFLTLDTAQVHSVGSAEPLTESQEMDVHESNMDDILSDPPSPVDETTEPPTAKKAKTSE